jgi:hypothetical protein
MATVGEKFEKLDKKEDVAIEKLRKGKTLISEALTELAAAQKGEAALSKKMKQKKAKKKAK